MIGWVPVHWNSNWGFMQQWEQVNGATDGMIFIGLDEQLLTIN